MSTNKTKIVLLAALTCLLIAIGYQNDFWHLSTYLRKTSVNAVDNKLIKQFEKNSENEGSVANKISQFFNLESKDLKKISKTYYKNLKKQKFIKNDNYYLKTSEDKYDLIILPTLVLEIEPADKYQQKIARLISDEIKYQTSIRVMPPSNAKVGLGGNHTIFDIEYVKKLAQKHDAKILFTLNKTNTNRQSNKIESELLFIIADSKGNISKTKEIQFTTSEINQSIEAIQSWSLAQVDLSKESIVKDVINEKYDNISGQLDNFFQHEHNKLEDACNSTKLGQWEDAEINRHYDKVSNRDYDIIVLPVQEINPRNDRVGRVMSSRFVAQEIKRQTGMKVMSPELALRLLGSNQILFDTENVNKLATKLSAKVVYLLKRKKRGRNFGRNLTDTELSVVLADNEGKVLKEAFYSLGKEDTRERRERQVKENYRQFVEELQDTLEVQVAKVQEQIVTSLFESTSERQDKRTTEPISAWDFPDSVSDIPKTVKTPLDNAAYFQLIGLLTPKMLDYDRKRLFERSLLALQEVDENSKYYNLLTARALFHLYRRPFAIPYLAEANLPAEKAFNSYMNGNLTELAEIVDKIQNPLLHSLSIIEQYQLSYSYYRSKRERESYKVPNSSWLTLIESATHDNDIWYAPDNLAFFISLKGLYPKFDRILEETLHGSAVVNDDFFIDKSFQIINGIFSLPGGPAPIDLDYQYSVKITDADIWNLYRNLSIANMLRSLKISVEAHGSYDTALKKAKELESGMNGHPVFQYLYAAALTRKAKQLPENEYRQYLEKAFKINDEVFYNTCGVTDYTLAAEYLVNGALKPILPKDRKYFHTPRFYSTSIDTGSYPTSLLQPSWKCRLLSLPFTNTRIDSLQILAEKNENDFVMKELEYRFSGHPEKAVLQAEMYFEKDQEDVGVKILSEAISNGDESWHTFHTLAKKFVEKEEYNQAKEILLKYPSFIDTTSGNRVHTSGYAYRAGGLFYNLGQYEEARPFFEIAASLSTGAGSQYRSIQKLAILEHDYNRVLEYSQKEAKRYNSSAAYYDFLTFLHVLGFHSDSRAAFQLLINRKGNEKLWISQYIGNRILQDDTYDIVKDFSEKKTALNKKNDLAHYVSLLTNVDRVPTSEDVSFLENIELNKPLHQKKDYTQERLNQDLVTTIFPIFSDVTSKSTESKIGSFSSFVNIDASIKNEKYGDALSLILQFINAKEVVGTNSRQKFIPPPIPNSPTPLQTVPLPQNTLNSAPKVKGPPSYTNDPMTLFMLPYLSMAVTKACNEEKEIKDFQFHISELRKHPRYQTRLFDFYLSEAVILADFGQYNESLEFLKKAFSNPKSGYEWERYRPYFRRYQLLQVSEWLYLNHGDKRFLELALNWARRIQKITPQHAWAYSFEALYGLNRDDKVHCAAFALYLDSKSHWLSKVDEKIKKEALDWWKLNNPFTLDQDKENKKQNEGV